MSKFKFKPLLAAIGIAMVSPFTSADLIANRTIVNNDRADERLEVSAKIPNGVTGDLYIAAQVNNQLFFLTNNGNGPQFQPSVEPYDIDVSSGTLTVLNLPSSFIPTGRIPLYQVLVHSGADPLDFNNWIGGFNGLSTIQIMAGLPTSVNKDFNNDGFPDDDRDRDGYHDDDRDRDGYHDDDRDRDGYHDDDRDRDGYHDDDRDRDGYHDDDRDRDGYHDDDRDRDGYVDDDSYDTPDTLGNANNGQALYTANCASCHGANPAQNINSILDGKDPARTRAAINSNTGGMGFLSGLSDSQLNDIASYIQKF